MQLIARRDLCHARIEIYARAGAPRLVSEKKNPPCLYRSPYRVDGFPFGSDRKRRGAQGLNKGWAHMGSGKYLTGSHPGRSFGSRGAGPISHRYSFDRLILLP